MYLASGMMATITLQPKASARGTSFAALARTLKVLGDPTRLAIVALLTRQEYCVCDLMAALNLPQSTCSHHLGVLRRAGLVRDRRGDDARWAYYSLVPEAVEALREQFGTVLDLSQFDPTPANCD
jgi:ArsR family transcriptional regulator, arsenate/arsenite/antimonite-responsive transcriptional repressor